MRRIHTKESYPITGKKPEAGRLPDTALIGNQASLRQSERNFFRPVIQRLTISDAEDMNINDVITELMTKIRHDTGMDPICEWACGCVEDFLLAQHMQLDSSLTKPALEDICMCMVGWYREIGQTVKKEAEQPDRNSDSGEVAGDLSLLDTSEMDEDELDLLAQFTAGVPGGLAEFDQSIPYERTIPHIPFDPLLSAQTMQHPPASPESEPPQFPPPFSMPLERTGDELSPNAEIALRTKQSELASNFVSFFIDASRYVQESRLLLEQISRSANIPAEQVAGMIRDDKHAGKNPFIFENEPHYTKSMLSALKLILTDELPMNADGYLRLHQESIRETRGLGGTPQTYRDISTDMADFHLFPGNPESVNDTNATSAGLSEYTGKKRLAAANPTEPDEPVEKRDWLVGRCTKILAGSLGEREPDLENESDILTMMEQKMIRLKGASGQQDADTANTLADKVFETYRRQMEMLRKKYVPDPHHSPGGSDTSLEEPALTQYAGERLEVIVHTCQTLEQLHLFSDANMRTVYLLLNKMLMDNGFPPTVLDEPNTIDFYSVGEIISLIKSGWEKYSRVQS